MYRIRYTENYTSIEKMIRFRLLFSYGNRPTSSMGERTLFEVNGPQFLEESSTLEVKLKYLNLGVFTSSSALKKAHTMT